MGKEITGLMLLWIVGVSVGIVVLFKSLENKLNIPRGGCTIEVAGDVIYQKHDGKDSKLLILKCPKGFWNDF